MLQVTPLVSDFNLLNQLNRFCINWWRWPVSKNLYKLEKIQKPTAETTTDLAENIQFPVDDERRFYQPRNEELTVDFDENLIWSWKIAPETMKDKLSIFFLTIQCKEAGSKKLTNAKDNCRIQMKGHYCQQDSFISCLKTASCTGSLTSSN